jgi:hypothetical protein
MVLKIAIAKRGEAKNEPISIFYPAHGSRNQCYFSQKFGFSLGNKNSFCKAKSCVQRLPRIEFVLG